MDNLHEPLTNEELAKQFNSSFDLVNHAIKLAVHMVQSGLSADEQDQRELNIANEVIHRLLEGDTELLPPLQENKTE